MLKAKLKLSKSTSAMSLVHNVMLWSALHCKQQVDFNSQNSLCKICMFDQSDLSKYWQYNSIWSLREGFFLTHPNLVSLVMPTTYYAPGYILVTEYLYYIIMYVCMYVCMYVYMHVYMHVCMYSVCNSCSMVTSVHGICSPSVNVFQRARPEGMPREYINTRATNAMY